MFWLYHGECVEIARSWPECSIDAVVCDPPYGLEFMQKSWDRLGDTRQPFKNEVQSSDNPFGRHPIRYGSAVSYGGTRGPAMQEWHLAWAREVLRVLKPGGHLLAFGGTRTSHRLVCAVEDAGFEIRDSIVWIYATGFPKSLNLGGGRGTALKPAHEPIVLARKPLDGSVAENVSVWDTGALNVSSCRVNADDEFGRWPANVMLAHTEDCGEGCVVDCSCVEIDRQSGVRKSGIRKTTYSRAAEKTKTVYGKWSGVGTPAYSTDIPASAGGGSRFFFQAKPSRLERDFGCEHLLAQSGGAATDRRDGSVGLKSPRAGAGRGGGIKNIHPTVKGISLMRYLVRLVTPVGGIVLDPFCGSGTTGMGAMLEDRRFVGIDQDPAYLTIAQARISAAASRRFELEDLLLKRGVNSALTEGICDGDSVSPAVRSAT